MALFSRRISDERFWLVYDANKLPISFDICWALAWAELQCRKRGEGSFNVAIIGPAQAFVHAKPVNDPDYVSRDELMWRVHQVLLPLASMYNSVSSVSVLGDDDVKFLRGGLVTPKCLLWPPSLQQIYRDVLQADTMPGGFSAPDGTVRELGKILPAQCGKGLVSITIRESKGGVVRNSDIEQWNRFSEKISSEGFSPVFVPDTDRWFVKPSFSGVTIPAIALNMALRVALYEMSALNMFVSSGPAAICSLSPNIPYLVFKILADGERLSSSEVVTDLGFHVGANPPFATRNQKWVWEDDSFDVLYREFRVLSLKNRLH